MFKSALKLMQKDFFNSFEFSLIIIFFFFILKIISSYFYYFSYEPNILNLSNVFGGYIESLYLNQDFKSCILDNQFTIFNKDSISCSYSARMPILPYLYFFFSYFSKKYFIIAIFKNVLLSLSFLIFFRIFYKRIIQINSNIFT